jgi:hypothetical protein
MPKSSGTIGMRCLVGLLQVVAMVVFCVIVHKIDVTTQSNTKLLAIHSEKLFEHEQNFEAIYFGTFSREFAHNVKGYIANEQGR